MDNKTVKILRESGTDESNKAQIKKISEKYNIPVKGIIRNIHDFIAENEILKKYKM